MLNDKFSQPDKADQDLVEIRERHAQEKASSKQDNHAPFCDGISIRSTGHSHSQQIEIEMMGADIRKLARKRDGDNSDEAPTIKSKNKSYLEGEMARYAENRGLD